MTIVGLLGQNFRSQGRARLANCRFFSINVTGIGIETPKELPWRNMPPRRSSLRISKCEDRKLTSPRHRSRDPILKGGRARCLPLLANLNVSHVRQVHTLQTNFSCEVEHVVKVYGSKVWVNCYHLVMGHLTVKVRSNLAFRRTFSDGVIRR
ncbi:hypothetical protein BJV78DRAFT_1241613 [Lactifluus subvellereus]|nr:hypothetical protein BJV78DRAFT_1241613 [Lactifluus subvellereus]